METKNEIEIQEKIIGEINYFQNASLLKISEQEQQKLLMSFDKKEIEIRPDGLIYLPQTFWRKRLNESFGIGQWCLIVKGSRNDPAPQKDKLYLQGVLMVRGNYVAESVGEAELHSSNPMQSWASVWESAKSDCITRCCKDLGIASELWQPEFIKSWIKDNALQVWREKTGKKRDGSIGSFQWRKKTSEKFYDEKYFENNNKAEAKQSPSSVTPPAEKINDNDKEWLNVNSEKFDKAVEYLKSDKTKTISDVRRKYKVSKEVEAKILTEVNKAADPDIESAIPIEEPLAIDLINEIAAASTIMQLNQIVRSFPNLSEDFQFNELINKQKISLGKYFKK